MNKPCNSGKVVMAALLVMVFLLTTFSMGWGQTYKIMPLGDSITKGIIGSSAPGGYRDDLQTLLSNEFVSYDFVGSQSTGSGFDADHEGHDGATTEYIDNNVSTWVSNASPDFVLLLIGTNDLGVVHNEIIRDRISSICDKIYATNSGITIFLSSLSPRSDNASKDSLATEVNKLIKRVAVDKKDAGRNIYYIGINELFRTNQDWSTDYMHDGIHPNDTGYNQMAQLFWSAIMNVIKKDGEIIIDNFNRSTIGVAWEYDPAFILETVAPGQRELKNSSAETRWNIMAVYKAVTNPGEVSIRWGKNATAIGIENGGLALRLNRAATNANGYLLRVKQNGDLNLWTIVNGSPSEDIASSSGTQPTAGQVFKVVLSSDAVAHHFHCYIDGIYVGTVSDYNKKRGNEAQLYAGVISKGSNDGTNSFENNVDDFNLHILGDITAPAKVTDLAVASKTGSTVTLTWKATGDDSLSDQASYYDIRYSKNALTDANWKDATKATNIEKPKAPGSTESFVVMGLQGDTRYYFGLKTADEEYNWSILSNIVDATTTGGAALQKSDEFTDPTTLTTWWSANPAYMIAAGELMNTSTANSWGHLAVFKVNTNPIEASITWSVNATSEGIDKGALALLLDSDNYTTANGYLAWIRTQVGDDPVLYLFTQKAGNPDVFLGTFTATGQKKPGPGDVFKIAATRDAGGHHFDYYLNEKFYGRISDPAKTYSDGTDYYMGIELHGNLSNNVERFVTVNTVGEPEVMQKVKPLGTPTGIVGTALSDSLIVRVTDKSGNPISGVNVDFTVTQGGGKVDITANDSYVRMEAEHAKVLENPMEIGVDPAASNSQYIMPNGGSAMEGKAEYSFYVKEAGTYVIWCRMKLPNSDPLSLFVQVDNSPAISSNPPTSNGVWDFRSFEPGPWEWRSVTDRAKNGDYAKFNLSKGLHTLRITQRVATGTKIDKILLSNNFNYVPSGLENVPQYITNNLGQARAQFTLGTVAGENRVEAMAPAYTLTGAPAIFVINGNADTPVSMVASSPTSQNGTGGKPLAQPFEVTLKDKHGNAAANYTIKFSVTEGDGFLSNGKTVHDVISDANGKAATYLTLGTETANNKVVASFGSLTSVTFTATATAGVANSMQYKSGNSQSAKVGTTLSEPLNVQILDKQSNVVANHNVRFQVKAGGGSLVPKAALGQGLDNAIKLPDDFYTINAAPTMDVQTDQNGVAGVRLVVGFAAGVNTVEATSNAGGSALPAVVFNATAIPALPDSLREVSGNNQTGAAGMQLSSPFIVKIIDQYQNPISGHNVKFNVLSGEGFLDGASDRTKSILTDPEGNAQVLLTLGSKPEVQNKVTAEAYIGEEILLNPGFETLGSGGLNLFANWTNYLQGSTTINDEKNDIRSGSHACRIDVVAGTEYSSAIYQDVVLNSLQEFKLTWWAKGVGAEELALVIYNRDTQHYWNNTNQTWVENYYGNKHPLTSSYEQYALVFTRENVGTTYRIYFRPRVNTNHKIYLDDISLTLNSDVGAIVLNSGLEKKNRSNMVTNSSELNQNTATPLKGSPVTFNAVAGVVTKIQAKSPLNHTGSAGWPLSDSLEVYIKDNYDNPVGGYPVTFRSNEGDNPGTFNGYSAQEVIVKTDNKGVARVAFFAGAKPGVVSRAKAVAEGLTGSPVTFSVTVAELAELKYEDGTRQTGSVGTALPKPFSAKVVDQHGRSIPKYDITFKVVKGDGNISGNTTATVKTDTTSKLARAVLTLGSAPGDTNNAVEASAIYNGKALKGSPIRYVASAIIGEVSELKEVSGNYQREVVGNPLEHPFIVKVIDPFGNGFAGHPVKFTVKTGGGFLDGNSSLKTVTKNTNDSGKVQVVLTVGTTAGQNNNSVEIVAFKPGSQTHLKNSPMTYFASATASAAHSLATVSGENQTRSPVRTALAQPFVVIVKDREGNPVKDHPVQWKVIQGSGTFDGLSDSTKTVNTNQNGQAQVYYYPGPIAGLQNVVRAQSYNQVELTGSPRTFVVDTKEGPISAARSDVSATSPIPADGVTQSKITVTLMDDWGNKISGKALTLSPPPTGSNNTYTSFSEMTDANGQAHAYLASTRAELKIISVKEFSGVQLLDTARVRFTPLEASGISYVSGTDQTGNYGTAVKEKIKARVYDKNGNPISDYPVTFEAYEGGGYVWECRESKPVFTDQNGIASASWILGPSAEVNRARAIAEGLSGSGSVRYIATARAGTAVRIQKSSGDTQTGTAGLPLNNPLVVKVVDNSGDPIYNYPVNFKVTFGGGDFGGASNVTINTNPFGEAIRYLTLGRIAGANVASVEASGLAGSPIGFTSQALAGPAAKIVAGAGAGKSGPVGGQISGIQVKVTDIFDNAVGGYTVNFGVNKGDASIIGSSAVESGPNGIASISLKLGNTMGEIEVLAAAPGLIGDGLKIKVYAVAATAVSMQIHHGNEQQGTIERELVYPFSVIVLDQHGNAAGGQNVPVSFVVTQGNGILLSGPTVYSDEKGIASARFQLGNVTGNNYKVWAINNSLTGSPSEFRANGVTNRFPLITPITPATIRENQNITFTISATDDDNDPIKFGARNLPQGALFDSLGTKQFSWTPNYFQSGVHEIHFIAKDNKGGFDDEVAVITVENVNRLPQITYYEPIAHELVGHKNIGESFRFIVQVNDPDNDEITYQWFDNGILVSAKNYFDFYVADKQVGSHYIVVKVSDGYDTVQRDWNLYVKTPVELAHFSGRIIERHGVELEWETTVETAHAGFNVYRRSVSEREYVQLNSNLIKADGTRKYRYLDRNITVGETYYFKLEDVSLTGEKTQHDAITLFVTKPDEYKLYQNYPNPFNPKTHIDYQLPDVSRVTIRIFNIIGQEVRTLVDETKTIGYHSVIWNGLDNFGTPVTSGIYYYRMETNSFVEVKKMLLLR